MSRPEKNVTKSFKLIYSLIQIVYERIDKRYVAWQRVTECGTMSDNEWRRVVKSFFFFLNKRETSPLSHHDTMISTHMKFPMNNYQSEGFQLNVITSLIWDIFSNGSFPSRICSSFFNTVLFLEKLLLHTSSG